MDHDIDVGDYDDTDNKRDRQKVRERWIGRVFLFRGSDSYHAKNIPNKRLCFLDSVAVVSAG